MSGLESEQIYDGMPRPYRVGIDCSLVDDATAERVMTEVFHWGARYARTVLDRLAGTGVAEHPFTTFEIAETKFLEVETIVGRAVSDGAATLRPSI